MHSLGGCSVTRSTAWIVSFSNQIPTLGIPSGGCPSKNLELPTQEGKIRIFWGEKQDFVREKSRFFFAKIPFYPLETHWPIPRHFIAGSWSKESSVFAFWKMNLDAVIYLLPLIVWAVPNVNSGNFKSIEEEKLSKGSEIPSKFTLQIGSGRWDYAEDPQLTLPGKNAGNTAAEAPAFGRTEHLAGWEDWIGAGSFRTGITEGILPCKR